MPPNKILILVACFFVNIYHSKALIIDGQIKQLQNSVLRDSNGSTHSGSSETMSGVPPNEKENQIFHSMQDEELVDYLSESRETAIRMLSQSSMQIQNTAEENNNIKNNVKQRQKVTINPFNNSHYYKDRYHVHDIKESYSFKDHNKKTIVIDGSNRTPEQRYNTKKTINMKIEKIEKKNVDKKGER